MMAPGAWCVNCGDNSQAPSHRRHNDPKLIHESRKLLGIKRLRPITEGFFRIVVDFNEQSVATCSDDCAR